MSDARAGVKNFKRILWKYPPAARTQKVVGTAYVSYLKEDKPSVLLE